MHEEKKSSIELIAEHYGWPLRIKARGEVAHFVGISAGSFPIYRFPGGDSVVSNDEMIPADE